MEFGDYMLACRNLDNNCKILDTPAKIELKLKCKIWTGNMSKNGYGVVSVFGKNMRASRVALQLSLCDDLNFESKTRHKCGNKHCIEPDHLEPGTHAQNMGDKVRDGTDSRGEKNPNCKINDDIARKIFWGKPTKSAKQRAKEFNISQSTVTAIDNGHQWKHLFSEEDRQKIKASCKPIAKKLTKEQIQIVKECKICGISKKRLRDQNWIYNRPGKAYLL